MSKQHPTMHAPLSYLSNGRMNLSALANELDISRPTLYQAIKEGRLVVDGLWAAYIPAKRGRPTKGGKGHGNR